MTKIASCLWFAPEVAPKAVELYTELIPNSRVVSTQSFSNADQPTGQVQIWTLALAGTEVHVMGSAHQEEFTTAHSMWLVVDDQAQLDHVWDGFLAAGGQEAVCSWITDPFGVKWQVVPKVWEELTSPDDPARAQRVVEALWQMTRVDVAALEAVAAQEQS